MTTLKYLNYSTDRGSLGKKLHALLKDETVILLHLELTIADDCDLWLLRAQFCLVILGPVRLFAQVELSHRQFLKKKSHFASSKSLGRNALGLVSLNCKLSHFLLVVKVF